MIAQLRREWDELRRTKERLRSERSTAREDRDWAVRERDEARWEARALRADLGHAVAQRLEAEEISAGLGTELAEVRGILQVKSDQHDLLCSAVVVVCDDLQVAQEEGTSSLMTCAAGIMARVGQLEEDAFHAGITQAFTVAYSHYDRDINLEVMSQGFVSGYEDSELDEIKKAVTPIARNLANELKDMVLPSRKYFRDDVWPLLG